MTLIELLFAWRGVEDDVAVREAFDNTPDDSRAYPLTLKFRQYRTIIEGGLILTVGYCPSETNQPPPAMGENGRMAGLESLAVDVRAVVTHIHSLQDLCHQVPVYISALSTIGNFHFLTFDFRPSENRPPQGFIGPAGPLSSRSPLRMSSAATEVPINTVAAVTK